MHCHYNIQRILGLIKVANVDHDLINEISQTRFLQDWNKRNHDALHPPLGTFLSIYYTIN